MPPSVPEGVVLALRGQAAGRAASAKRGRMPAWAVTPTATGTARSQFFRFGLRSLPPALRVQRWRMKSTGCGSSTGTPLRSQVPASHSRWRSFGVAWTMKW